MIVTTKGSGPDAVLVHGLGATHYTWRGVVAKLEAESAGTCHLVDVPGFGVAAMPSEFDMESRAKDLIADIVGAELKKVRLVGHSMGGCICLYVLKMLAEWPTPAPFEVEKVVLIGAVSKPKGIIDMGIVPLNEEMARVFLRTILVVGSVDKSWISKDVIDAYVVNFYPADRYKSVSKHGAALKEIINLEDEAQNFDLPSLVVWGEKDPLVSLAEFGEPLAAALPNAHLHIVPDCGHTPHEESPDKCILKIVEFLKA